MVARSRVVWFYGADAVGKSVVGWEAYRQLIARGVPAAYVDTDYLGFCDPRPADPAQLVAANLAAIWANYARHGIRYLVVSGILVTAEDQQTFAAALGNCTLMTVLLHARPDRSAPVSCGAGRWRRPSRRRGSATTRLQSSRTTATAARASPNASRPVPSPTYVFRRTAGLPPRSPRRPSTVFCRRPSEGTRVRTSPARVGSGPLGRRCRAGSASR